MHAHVLLLPTEKPPTTLDIKRALLTFDCVVVPSPEDRELIPPSWFHTVATGMPPVFGLPAGPVRPLGKVPDYDSVFDALLDTAGGLLSEGLIKVRAAPIYGSNLTIGGIPIPEGLPHPAQVYSLYRILASAPEIVGAVSRGIDPPRTSDEEMIACLAPSGADDGQTRLFIDGKPVGSPHLSWSVYPGVLPAEDLRPAYSRLCYARIGSLTKWLLIADREELVPYTTDIGFGAGLQLLDRGMCASIDDLTPQEQDRELIRRLAWLEQIAIAEFVDAAALDALSFAEVVKLRTTAWGAEGEARIRLFAAAKSIAESAGSKPEFLAAAQQEVEKYRKAREELDRERSKLVLAVTADIGVGATKVGGFTVAAEMLQKLFAAGSPEVALVLGAVHYLLRLAKEQGPVAIDYIAKRKNMEESPGYALFDPYRRLM